MPVPARVGNGVATRVSTSASSDAAETWARASGRSSAAPELCLQIVKDRNVRGPEDVTPDAPASRVAAFLVIRQRSSTPMDGATIQDHQGRMGSLGVQLEGASEQGARWLLQRLVAWVC